MGRDEEIRLTANPAWANSLCVGSFSHIIRGTFWWGQALVTGFCSAERGDVSGACMHDDDNDNGEMRFDSLDGWTDLCGLLFVILVERRAMELSPDDGGCFFLVAIRNDVV